MMTTTRVTFAAFVAALALSACAQSPDQISTASVSPMLYSGLNCTQIQGEANRINTRLTEITGNQQQAANSDAVMMGVGLILFWPSLFFIGHHEDHAPEIARLRGETEALQTAAQERRCVTA